MLVSEESVAALEAEVAEALGILEELPVESGEIERDEIAAVIHRYAGHVAHIGLAAGEAGFLGLQDTCLLFQENLTTLAASGQGLSDAERERLEEWPILVIGYLVSPEDPQSSDALLEHLQNPVWSTPLPAEEANVLRALLMPAMEQHEPDEVPKPLDELDNVPSIFSDERPKAEIADPLLTGSEAAAGIAEDESELPTTLPHNEEISISINETNHPEQVEPAAEFEQNLEPIKDSKLGFEALAEPESTPELIPESVFVKDLKPEFEPSAESVLEPEFNTLVEPEPISELLPDSAFVKDLEPELEASIEPALELKFDAPVIELGTAPRLIFTENLEPASAFEAPEEPESTPELISDSAFAEDLAPAFEPPAIEEPELESESAPESVFAMEPDLDSDSDSDEEIENPEISFALGAAQQELLEILCAEIMQISEISDEILDIASAADSSSEARIEAISSYAEYLERLGDASASINLIGLQQTCACLHTNLLELATQESPLNPDQRGVVESWPILALSYLQAPDDRSQCMALAQCLQDARWPQPLSDDDVAALTDQLFAPKLVTEEAEAETRPQQAQADDISLELPPDVNPDLLDGLLQELPYQAADFSAAVQRLSTGEGQLADVDVARRIAHTLKGAGNTVGVRGIATLTHHTEDILQALSKHGVLPTRSLADTLLNAADCLETMSEALLGVSAPPPQALAVLQTVLDWANRIDREGVPTGDEILPPPTSLVAPAPAQALQALEQEAAPAPATQQPTPSAEVTLRVPASLVDDLLRLVGESIILTSQVQERIRKTLIQSRAVTTQNQLFQNLAAELEQLVDIRNVSSPLSRSMQRGDFDPLELEQYDELNTVTHRLVEAATDSREMNRAVEDNLRLLDSLLVDQGRLHRDSQEAVLRTRMVPIQTVVPRLQRSVRQTSRLVDKEAELIVRGADTLMDSNVLNSMVDPLMHILRNAVDHGIESPAERQRLGKPPVGRIELHFMREGGNIAIHCRDDGAGLDLNVIRRLAEERGLITPGKSLEPDELARLILLPGFSTRGVATQTSGRGIGMDMVYTRLLELKGSLRIQTERGKGCLMELRLPVTLISTHALLLRVREQVYALSDRGIEQILYSDAGTIQTLGNTTTYRLGNDLFEFTSLNALFNLPHDRREQGRSAPPVLLVREETGGLHAVMVQELLDSRDLVVKNLGQYIPKLPGIVGATILGDGSVAPVLDLPELLRAKTAALRLPMISQSSIESTTTSTPHRRIVLAVDDSLSARRSLAQFVQDAGFEVRTARDGLEAIEIINGKTPDLVLADLEMPRMNGLELTAHLRANQATHTLPVIMITSRSTAKHRHEAEVAGVDVYLTKPFMEDELIEQMHRLLHV